MDTLCPHDGYNSMVMWIVGTVTSLWFFNGIGKLKSQVSVRVAPINSEMGDIAREVLHCFSDVNLGKVNQQCQRLIADNLASIGCGNYNEIHASKFVICKTRGQHVVVVSVPSLLVTYLITVC